MNRTNSNLGYWALGLAGVVAAGATAYYFWRRATDLADQGALAASPEVEPNHAVSAVTGGLPEDMNGMPPTEDFEIEGPIYDGHDLESQKVANT